MPFDPNNPRLYYISVKEEPIDLDRVVSVGPIEKRAPTEPFYKADQDDRFYQSPDQVFWFTIALRDPTQVIQPRRHGWKKPIGDYQDSAKGARYLVKVWRDGLLDALELHRSRRS
jgi:hypothetical protein